MSGFDSIASHADALLRWLLITSVSATLISGVVLIMQTIFDRWLSPAGRQRLWLLVVIRLLLPILPASAMSVWNLHFANTLAKPHVDAAVVADHDEMPSMDVPLAARSTIAIPVSSAVPPVQRSWSDLISIAGCGAWGGVALVLLSRLLWINRATSIRLRRAIAITDEAVLWLAEACANVTGLRTVPTIVMTDAVRTPAVHGIWRARILMPVGLLESLTPIQQRHIILHEMSHIRHWDVLGNWMLALLNIIHWFNPLLWLTFSRLKADRELTRDAWVMRITTSEDEDAASYANTLIDLAQRISVNYPITKRHLAGDPFAPSLPGLFGRTTNLRRRLHMIARLSDSHRGSKVLSVGLLLLIGGGVLTRARAQTPPAPSAAPTTTAIKVPTTRPTTRRAIQQRLRPTVDSLTTNIQEHIANERYSRALDDINLLLQMNPGNAYALGVRPFVIQKAKSVPEDQIGKGLKRMLPTVQFDGVGIQDVFMFVSDISGLPIDINWKALDALQIDHNTPITVNAHNIPLNTALTLILDQLGGAKGKLDYTIGAGYIYITTADELKDIHLRSYDVTDLLTGNDGKTRQQRLDELVKMIKEYIDHDTWKDNGGFGNITERDGSLIVSQHDTAHRHVIQLLQTLRNGRTKKD